MDHAKSFIASDERVVLAGDYNVMPTDLDVYAPERWLDDALFRPEVRNAYRRLVAQGWTDAVRKLHPGERIYTFWDYWRNAFARNAGLRIDHLLLSPPLAKRLTKAGVDREVRGREKASDHAPAWIELSDRLSRRGTRRRAKRSPKGVVIGKVVDYLSEKGFQLAVPLVTVRIKRTTYLLLGRGCLVGSHGGMKPVARYAHASYLQYESHLQRTLVPYSLANVAHALTPSTYWGQQGSRPPSMATSS